MTSHDQLVMSAIAMEDDLGIVYLVETAQQFWSGTYILITPLYGITLN